MLHRHYLGIVFPYSLQTTSRIDMTLEGIVEPFHQPKGELAVSKKRRPEVRHQTMRNI